jgi:hypothetical protein
MKQHPRIVVSLGVALAVAAGVVGAGSLATVPAHAQGACDPSYPELCLPAYPDLDCIDIGYPITVRYDPNIGAFDPHYLDVDFDGIGCELG